MDLFLLGIYSFGPVEQLLQAYFAVLSLYPYLKNSNIKLTLFTDRPSYFSELTLLPGLNLNFYHLSPTLLADWKGVPLCNFRVKIKSLIQGLESTENFDAVIILDSDVFALKSPMDLFYFIKNSSGLVFSEPEGLLGAYRPKAAKQLWKYLKSKTISYSQVSNQNEQLFYRFEKGMPLYNAGIIGASKNDLQLFREALHFFDHFYQQTAFYFAEQLSLVRAAHLSKKPVCTSMKYFCHYWYDKNFRVHMEKAVSEFKNNPSEQASILNNLPFHGVLPFHQFFSLKEKWKRKILRFFRKYLRK